MKGYAIIVGLGLALLPAVSHAADRQIKPPTAEMQDSFSYVCLEYPNATALVNGLTFFVQQGMHPKLDCFPPTDEPCNSGTCKEIICHGTATFTPAGSVEEHPAADCN